MARFSWFQYHLLLDVLIIVSVFLGYSFRDSLPAFATKERIDWTSAHLDIRQYSDNVVIANSAPATDYLHPASIPHLSSLSEDAIRSSTPVITDNNSTSANNTYSSPDTLPMRTEYEFAVVADLDLASRDPNDFKWHSYLKKGVLKRHPNGNYSISWTDTIKLSTQTATNNRSMELSELIKYQGSLLSVCDYTGIVYKIDPSEGSVFQRHALADGNGQESKPFKAEWATLKDDLMYIGSIGKEWTRDGKILHFNPQWVKVIDSCGYITNRDWGMKYNFLRNVTNTTYPGYLIHEAVVWDQANRNWLFLPRRASTTEPYSPQTEENYGSNLLIIVDEEFKQAIVKRIGPLQSQWGFTSLKLIPETNELIALKVREINSGKNSFTETVVTIFDREGKFKLESEPWLSVSNTIKYEGLEFL